MGEESACFGAGQHQDPQLPTVPGAEHAAAESPLHPQMASASPSLAARSAKSSLNITRRQKSPLTAADLWGQSWCLVGARQ